jgi:DNA-binding LacI/PurR family transcriptional regulator/DNA-binding transcriptional regulator YhcF (GntR family)
MRALTKKTMIAEDILGRIHENRLKPGEGIFSESEIMSIYNVSRITARAAVQTLKDRGALVSVKGKGTFVHPQMVDQNERIHIQLIAPFLVSGTTADCEWGGGVVLDEFEKAARTGNGDVCVSVSLTRDDVAAEREAISAAAANRHIHVVVLDPVCNTVPGVLEESLKPLVSSGKLFLILERWSSLDVNNVYEDDLFGAFLATTHLIGLGHRDILHVNLDCPFLARRVSGYRIALIENGIPVRSELEYKAPVAKSESKYALDNEIFRGIGYAAVQKTIKESKYTAVFAANDLIADGCRQALDELGLRVPEDISLVGYDDMPFARRANHLTTISRPFAKIGRMAAQLALKATCKPLGSVTEKIAVKPTLVERRSTQRLPQAHDARTGHHRSDPVLLAPMPMLAESGTMSRAEL